MKFENAEQKDERMRKYAGMFSSESILYLYRPPTPDLLSEEELEQKNYTEILEEVKKKAEKSSTLKKESTRKAEESSKKAGLNQQSASGKGGLEK